MNSRERAFFNVFVDRMRGEFEVNAKKGDWTKLGVTAASLELDHHVKKLISALTEGDKAVFLERLADIANSACIYAGALGLLDDGVNRPPYVEPEYDLGWRSDTSRLDY